MASFQQRGTAWRASVMRRGQRRTGTFDSKREAIAWASATEAALDAGEPTPSATPAMTAELLFARYAREVSPSKGGARWERVRLLSLPRTSPAFSGPLSALDAVAMAAWRDARLLTVQASTVNREMNLIGAVLTYARKEWRVAGLDPNPMHAIMRPRNPPPRSRRISPDERDAIVAALGWDGKRTPKVATEWIAWSFCLALHTAMRKGEILALSWPHVHLDRLYVHLPKTKNGHSRDVPLSPAALGLFALLEAGKGDVVPVASGTFTTLFGRAKAAAGLDDIHFHDARREGTTEMATKLGLLELASSTGHRSVDLLRQVYYQPDMTAIARKLG